MKVTQKLITELALDPNNARKHSEKNLEAIATSLTKFGQRKPIVVHNGVVIAGNGTLSAAKSLGWTEITVSEVPSEWDAETAKAYALADNRTAELAEWDESILAEQLFEMVDSGWDITDLGFESTAQPQADDWADSFDKTAQEQKPFGQMTFILSTDQTEIVKNAIEASKALGPFLETGNDNSNGNALARMAEIFLGTQV